jgi:hypothetical protein
MANIDNINFMAKMYSKIQDIQVQNDIKNTENLDDDLDYILKTKKNSKKVKKIKKPDNSKYYELAFFIILAILFYFLNSYFVINLINMHNIDYNIALAGKTVLFIIFVYILQVLLL